MIKYFQIILLALSISCVYSQDTIYNGRYRDTIKIKPIDKKIPICNYTTDPNNFDVRLFRSINNSRSKFKDAVIPIFDKSAPPITLFMPLSMMVYSRFKKNFYDENTGYLLGVSEGLNLMLTFGVKYYFKRARPYAYLDNVYCKNSENTDPYSFPSGHTSISFNIAVMFNLRYPDYPHVYVPIYLYSLIVAYGRPYLGMHFPSDLLGGAAIGAGSAILVYSLRKPLFKIKNKILSEEKTDEGSINGKAIYFFGGAFIASSIIGHFIFKDNDKIQISVLPYGKQTELLSMNLNVRF